MARESAHATLTDEEVMSNLLNIARVGDISIPPVRLAAAALLLASASTVAAAAELPTKAAQPPAYQWTGCYLGINGGAGASASDVTTTVGAGTYLTATDPATVSADGSGSANDTKAIGGGQAGCNWQTNTVVFGLEGDFDYFSSNANFFNNTDTLAAGTPFVVGQSLTTNYLATVRPRIGIAADRNFAYITGGVAFTDASYTETYSDAAGGVGSASASKFLAGWTVGAGWEYAWSEHWTLRFEYLFADFQATHASGLITGPGGSNPLSGSGDLVIQVARAGVNYKF
jgi:outer membrane immunogenic protein